MEEEEEGVGVGKGWSRVGVADELKNDNGDDDGDGCCCGGGWLLLYTWSDCLHVPGDGFDVVAREHARLAVAASFPPVGVRVVQDLDEVATSETQLSFLLWVKVKECLHVCGMLCDLREGGKKKKKGSAGSSYRYFQN